MDQDPEVETVTDTKRSMTAVNEQEIERSQTFIEDITSLFKTEDHIPA